MYYTGKTQKEFQHTAARRRLDTILKAHDVIFSVSTHSRPKAAGDHQCAQRVAELEFQHTAARRRLGRLSVPHTLQGRSFNTQPPEGGWEKVVLDKVSEAVFQHTAARRRLGAYQPAPVRVPDVSTHSRPKAAGSISASTCSST